MQYAPSADVAVVDLDLRETTPSLAANNPMAPRAPMTRETAMGRAPKLPRTAAVNMSVLSRGSTYGRYPSTQKHAVAQEIPRNNVGSS